MASRPPTNTMSNSLFEQLAELIDDKLDRVASNMLEVIQHMLQEQTESIEKSVQTLQNPIDNLWRNNGKAITRGT
jgi:predicted house-cleaning noncanonical NTP pyrophosphatase (MazG superfamily)